MRLIKNQIILIITPEKNDKTAGCRSQFQSKQSELENIGIKDAEQ